MDKSKESSNQLRLVDIFSKFIFEHDEDCTGDTSISKSEDSQETNVSDLPSDDLGKHEACLATFRSPDMQNEHCLHEDHDPQSDAENHHVDNRMHVDLLDADLGSGSLSDARDSSNTTYTSSHGKLSPHASSIFEQNQSEATSELPNDNDSTSKLGGYEDPHRLTDPGSHTVSNCKQSEGSSFSTSQVTCTQFEIVKPRGHVGVPSSQVDTHCSRSTDVLASDQRAVKASEDNSNNQMVVNVSGNCLNDTSDLDTNSQLQDLNCSADKVVYSQEDSVHQNALVNNRIDQHPVTVPPQNTASLHLSSNSQPVSPSQYSQTSQSPDCCGIDHAPHCTSLTGSQCLSNGVRAPETDAAEESHDLSEASIEEAGSHNQNICLSYVESSVEAHDSEQTLSDEDKYEHSAGCHNEQSLELESDSSYTHPGLDCSTHDSYHVDSDSEVSSYRQHISNDAEEMDTGVLDDDDDDVPGVVVNSSVYQSYEDDVGTQYVAGAAAVGLVEMPLVAHYDTTDSHITEVNPSEDVCNVAVLCSSQTVSDDTSSSSTACVLLQDTVTDAATSTAEEAATSTSSSSPSLSSHQLIGPDGAQERMFSHGEQAFMQARQAASVPFVPAGCQLPYVPGMNPSMYAGAAMVQGLGGPTMMTSSSVHIAQHPGGATIMQHQSMSTGLSGAMSQATVMQQQAMANGLQATSLLQRTLTNGGQTMVVQQRTMTTGLDGMTQQTMMQQQMATPGMPSAAMFHANAMRQRTLASQQASMMQQRSIRLVQTGMVGNPMMHAQAMGGQALMRGGSMPTTLIQHGMLRGVSQGTMMQQLVRQRYLGGPVMPGRGVQLMAGRPIRIKMTYPRESMPMDT